MPFMYINFVMTFCGSFQVINTLVSGSVTGKEKLPECANKNLPE